jgi:hypothetical protein
VPSYDGSLIARSKFGNLDSGWVTSLIYYIALKLDVREVSSWAQFGTTPATISVTGDTVKIALVGDWGTGEWTDGAVPCPALQVIDKVKSQAPDYTIHLGDVYYAGTAGFFDSDEEVTNFVNYWISGSQGSFMLNSNHEMYSGAQGYFGKALNTAPFALQQNTSYFALQSDKWIIIALDTAYYDTSSLFMNGALTDAPQSHQRRGNPNSTAPALEPDGLGPGPSTRHLVLGSCSQWDRLLGKIISRSERREGPL